MSDLKNSAATFSQDLKVKDSGGNVIETISLELNDKWNAERFATADEADRNHCFAMVNEHILRQFVNNQEANAKARAKKFAAAKTDAEREENRPLTAAEYVKIWEDYKGPAISGTPRQSAMEKLRFDATIAAYFNECKRHNDAIDNGSEPTGVFNTTDRQALAFAPIRNQATGKVEVTVDEQRTALVAGLQERAKTSAFWNDAIQLQLELLIAARSSKSTAAPTVKVTSALSALA